MSKFFNKTQILGSFLFVFMLLIMFGCGSQEKEVTILEQPYDKNEFLMGTYVSLRVYDEGKEDVLDLAIDRIAELADKITVNEPGSEMDNVNKEAGKKTVTVSKDVFPLIERAAYYSALPNSGFDYTIGPVTDLWRIGFDDARVPEPEEIETALPLVNHEKVELNVDDQTVYLTEAGMKLDLGAIAKGYIADEVKKVFQDNGVTTAIIDLGGNIIVMGDSPNRDTGGFNVGVQDPFESRGSYVAALNLKNQSIVTSGIYERYIEKDGEIFHHLMNPETGYPFENELASTTIISDDSIDGDALSTVVFGMGLEAGLDYVNGLNAVEAIFITKDYEVYTSAGLKEKFSITNENYSWVNE